MRRSEDVADRGSRAGVLGRRGTQRRPFKGLRTREPCTAYDVVVIGAGIGGLFCAAKLAKEGLRVLLVERHYMVGGYCSTFRRRGYVFDAATTFYPLLGNPSTLTGKLLTELGIETRWAKMDPVDAFHFPDGTRFTVPADFDTYRAKLDASFPRQKASLERFFAAVRETYLKGLLCYFKGVDTARLGPWAGWTMRQALDHFFTDRKLKLLLTADCAHWGSPPSRTSFVFDSMLRLSYFLGNYYPEGGSQAFADELARRFEQLGGHILMATEAERILVRRGRVCGVRLRTTRGRLAGGRRIGAGAVVSNADLKLTYGKLLDARWVAPELLDSLATMRSSYPCFLSHIGLQGVAPESLERVQGYHWKAWDPDRVGQGGLLCKVVVPTRYEPRMAPRGGQIVMLQKVIEMDYRAVDDWAAHKAEVERRVTDHLEGLLPGIRDRIVVQTSASAHTSWRFTANEAGAMLGWEMSPDQLGERRPANHGPVDGLHLVGHWVRPGGGITPVIVSAMQVAETLVRARPPERAEALLAALAPASGLRRLSI
ncbi:MAG: NAD(P)/FAD-dependent oxidoreductase [Acidobacteriota bacterium]